MTRKITLSRRERLAQLSVLARELQVHAAHTPSAYGRALIEVRDDQLNLEGGDERLSLWVEHTTGRLWSTAQKARMVAKHFHDEMAERAGTELLTDTVRSLEATALRADRR